VSFPGKTQKLARWGGGDGVNSTTATAIARRYGTAFLDIVYPRRCEMCETLLDAGRANAGRWLCDPCLKALPRIEPPFCNVCGEPYEGEMTDAFRCGNCADLKLHFDFAIAPYRAEGSVRELVHRFKYNQRLDLRGVLGCLLAHALQDSRFAGNSDWLIVPVPLHPARERERQYNQAWELCQQLTKITGWPAERVLSRVRATPQQAALTRHQRIENLRNAFSVKQLSKLRKVLLVDDVLTTGSTTSECARVLKRNGGAEKVVVITVARG
jgi:ComF family protein